MRGRQADGEERGAENNLEITAKTFSVQFKMLCCVVSCGCGGVRRADEGGRFSTISTKKFE